MASSDPYQIFNFTIEIDSLLVGGFSECSGLQVETEIFEYREGGLNEYMHSFTGSVKYTPLVLKHGLTSMDGLWNWYQQIANNGINQGVRRRNGTIYLLDTQKNPVKVWNFKQAFPYKWSGPELRADSSEVAFESIELMHQGLNQVPT